MELTTALDAQVGEGLADTMAECAEMDQGYPLVAMLRAVAVMASADHPAPLTDAQVHELLDRIEQEGNRLLGREA